jgi:uncharacterized protein with PQ loop repeat
VDNLGETITWIFVMVNSARLLAYLPQIHAAWRCTDGARSISMLTWSYFALAHLTGAFYSWSVANDPKLAAVFVGNCLACSALVAVVGWKRRNRAISQPKPDKETINRLVTT